jgi:hypothetical protein
MSLIHGAIGERAQTDRAFGAHTQAMAHAEVQEELRPANLFSGHWDDDPTTTAAAGDEKTITISLPKGFRWSAVVFQAKDSENWVCTSFKVGQLVVKSESERPANLDSFRADRDRNETIAAYILKESSDKIDVTIKIKSLVNSNLFRGVNIEGIDGNQDCALEKTTQMPKDRPFVGFKGWAPALVRRVAGLIGGADPMPALAR